MCGDEHGVGAHVETAVAAPRQPDQLDAIAELARHRNVGIGDLRDALAVNLVCMNELAKGQRRENRDLVGNIERFDIVSRIGFGILFYRLSGTHCRSGNRASQSISQSGSPV